jgi:hypothetical protein
MKTQIRQLLYLFVAAFTMSCHAQHLGNYNNVRSEDMGNAVRYNPAQQHQASLPAARAHLDLKLRSLYNIEATDYTAVFNINQVGPSSEKTLELMENRIEKVKSILLAKGLKEEDFTIDMISFVPKYEIEVTKKLFSKTYTEVPVGFALQQNLLINYQDDSLFPAILSACASAEIYNLVKVDYYIDNIQEKYQALEQELLKKVEEKRAYYEKLGFTMADYTVTMGEQRYYHTPKNFYKSYQAANTVSMESMEKNQGVQRVEKPISYYYEPIGYQGYDIVLNPAIRKPVIQLGIDLVLLYVKKPEQQKQPEPITKTVVKQKYFIISQEGVADIIELPEQ